MEFPMLNQPKRIQAMAAALLLAGLAMNPQSARAQQDDPGAKAHHQEALNMLELNPGIDHNPISVMVKFKAGASENDKGKARQSVNGIKRRAFGLVPGLELLETRIGVAQAVAQLRNSSGVEYAEPDYVVHSFGTSLPPSDNYWNPGAHDGLTPNLLWGLHNDGRSIGWETYYYSTDSWNFYNDKGTQDADIDALEAWQTTTGNAGFTIAIIDTGMDLTHPDLQPNLWTEDSAKEADYRVHGYDFITHTPMVGINNYDPNGHGTHTAGTIGAAANNIYPISSGVSYGVVGVNWSCKLMPLRFLNTDGSGYTSDAIEALNYAVSKGVKVSNNSWGGGSYSTPLFNAISNAKEHGHLFVAAAGNEKSNNDTRASYPACYNLDNIIAVAATDNDDRLASFSNYGAKTVELGAPGVNIISSYPVAKGGFAWLNGTSMATPHVAGVAALVWGYYENQNPTPSYTQIKSKILDTVRPVSSLAGKTITGGVVNAYEALGVESSLPFSPRNLSAAPSGITKSSVTLNWVNKSTTVANYDIERSKDGITYAIIKSVTYTAGELGKLIDYTDSPVSSRTTYYYRVRASNAAGKSHYSNSLKITTPR